MSTDAPSNSFYTVLGEINLLLTSLKKTHNKYTMSPNHYQDNPQDPLLKNLYDLKTLLNDHTDFTEIDPTTFLSPFLEVIKSEETTGPVTGMALTSLDKFISYGLIKVNSETTASCVQQIADSITHARFVGTDSSSDEVVLMKILHVLRTLMLSPIGYYLTNSSVCEIMQSCFQICFENRLTELLRRSAENILVDMVQLLFARLPQFKEEFKGSVKKLTMKSDGTRQKKSKKNKIKDQSSELTVTDNVKTEGVDILEQQKQQIPSVDVTTPLKPEEDDKLGDKLMELNDQFKDRNKSASESESTGTVSAFVIEDSISVGSSVENGDGVSVKGALDEKLPSDIELVDVKEETDYVNPRGVRFVQDGPNGVNAANVPYGLPCVRELLRFLISLISFKNTDVMISMGLNLLTIGLELGVDHVASYQSLLSYVKDDLCQKIYNLFSHERTPIYANALRVSFLLFESQRFHLKLQMEHFMIKFMDIIVSDSPKLTHEQKYITIDHLLQLLRIPGVPTELYLNYDCSLNCSNIFEDLTKLLSKNAFSVQPHLTPNNSLSLQALLTIIDNIKLENSISHSLNSDKHNIMSTSLTAIRAPPASGFMAANQSFKTLISQRVFKQAPTYSSKSHLRINRMKIDVKKLPKVEELKLIRTKKRLIIQSTDLFNASPTKAIQFLKDNKIFSHDAETSDQQLIEYLRETQLLDKKVIGEYLTKRANLGVLKKFVESFNFSNLRIDEALRMFLETFRLPGEAPLISTVMEHFAKHWRDSNGQPLANDDAAFTLAYAIIMLNVDQHNHNVKKQSTPMDIEAFKKNLTKVNGGSNFESELLEQIYAAIKQDEIVMPSEHAGVLRDNYLWKLLIRRGAAGGADSEYVHAPTGSYNHEIFGIVWGQTVSALSFVYDRSVDVGVVERSICGFRKCAQVAAFYMMSDVFDNIVISLCKFTALSHQVNAEDQLAINFGSNNKAQLACKTVFQLTHNHGDILRDGWRNILDCIIQLYKAKLLPKVLIECEDFINPSGRILLIKKNIPPVQKSEGQGGLFSSFFPFMSNDLSATKGPTQEDLEATKNAQSCIDDCHIEQLIHDTKFLRFDSLLELIKALIFQSQINEPDSNNSPVSSINITNSGSLSGSSGITSSVHNSSTLNVNSTLNSTDTRINHDSAVFSLEILIKVVLQNRDRIPCIWPLVRNHFCNIIINTPDYSFLLERTVVGLLRISDRLLRREEFSTEVLASLRMLLIFKKKATIRRLSRQVTYGLHDLLRTNAANIHTTEDWANIFTILQVYGVGSNIPILSQQQQLTKQMSVDIIKSSIITSVNTRYYSNENLSECSSEMGDRGYTSDSEVYQHANSEDPSLLRQLNIKDLANQYKIDLDDDGLGQHDKKAFVKCCEVLNFLTRDMAYVTTHNFESCVHCLRSFVEACVIGERSKVDNKDAPRQQSQIKTRTARRTNQQTFEVTVKSDESDVEDQFVSSYETLSIQLLDLLDTLHNKAASVFVQWAEEQRQKNSTIDSVVSSLWSRCWCPILQGIARLSCDRNAEVRMHALQYLQRALLVHELQKLSAMEWEACFNKVLFPLLAKLLENIDPRNAVRMEETRMRASTLLCKVFLQHLTTLAKLSTFTALWLTILDYMDKYMKSDKSDLLHDVIPESLKNMLLVMETTGLFNKENSDLKFSQLCTITKDRIESFLPGLWEDLFKVSGNSDKLKKEVSIVVETGTTEAAEVVMEVNEDAKTMTKDLEFDMSSVSNCEKDQEVQNL